VQEQKTQNTKTKEATSVVYKQFPSKPLTSVLAAGWGILIVISTALMIDITLPYTSWEWDVDFLQTKFEIVHLLYYRAAFYTHIFTSSVVLFSGLFLFSNWVLRRRPRVHRFFGKTYVLLVLVFSAPSGMVMACHANGGWSAKLSFVILTALWWWFTYKGYVTARALNFKAHKKWMIRSYALTFSAITLRFSQMLLGMYFLLDPVFQYVLVSWSSWVINLLVAEVLIRKVRITNRQPKVEMKLASDY